MDNFIGKVYGLTGVGLLVTALVTFLTMGVTLSTGAFIAAFVGTLLLVLGACATRGLVSAGFFLGVSALEGVMILPLVKLAIATNPLLVVLAAALAGLIFLALTAYVFVSGKDFSFMGGGLLIALLALIVASIASIFIPGLGVFVAAAGVIVFGLFVLYDTSTILGKQYEDNQYPVAALNIYLDIMGLFINILRICLEFGGD